MLTGFRRLVPCLRCLSALERVLMINPEYRELCFQLDAGGRLFRYFGAQLGDLFLKKAGLRCGERVLLAHHDKAVILLLKMPICS